jgi:hypothetical protein
MDKYIPAANSPSWKVLTKRIIPKLVDELQNAAKKETRGKNATLQADGWTGGNHRHPVAFMITADKKVWTYVLYMIVLDVNKPIKVYTVWVHNASTERKTADKFLTLLEEVVKEIEEKWGSIVVAIVTDVTTLILNEYRQSSNSSVLVFKFGVQRQLRLPIARYCLSVELVRVRSKVDS